MAAHGTLAVLELVAAVPVKVAALCLVLADVLIDALHGYHRIAFQTAIADNLLWRPLPLAHIAVDAVLNLACKGAFTTKAVLTHVCKHLSMGEIVFATVVTVAF